MLIKYFTVVKNVSVVFFKKCIVLFQTINSNDVNKKFIILVFKTFQTTGPNKQKY